MATISVPLLPGAAENPATNFPQYLIDAQRRPVLAFDAATAETCYWTGFAPQGITALGPAIINYYMTSATSGKVDFEIAIEAITDGDSTDLDATTSFDTANTITAPTVPGTAGYLDQISCTLTNADSIAAGDYFRLSLKRDAADGTNDTATGDAYVLGVELRITV